MSRFDEEPDGDPHGECSAEIDRLKALNAELAAAVQAFLDYDEETTDLGLMAAYDDALTKSHAAMTKHKETT